MTYSFTLFIRTSLYFSRLFVIYSCLNFFFTFPEYYYVFLREIDAIEFQKINEKEDISRWPQDNYCKTKKYIFLYISIKLLSKTWHRHESSSQAYVKSHVLLWIIYCVIIYSKFEATLHKIENYWKGLNDWKNNDLKTVKELLFSR